MIFYKIDISNRMSPKAGIVGIVGAKSRSVEFGLDLAAEVIPVSDSPCFDHNSTFEILIP